MVMKMHKYERMMVLKSELLILTQIENLYRKHYNHFHLDYAYYGPHAAYFRDPFYRTRYSPFGYYDPFWNGPPEYRERTSYVASAEILMGKGEKPVDAAYFDAEQVVFNLGANIMRPQPK